MNTPPDQKVNSRKQKRKSSIDLKPNLDNKDAFLKHSVLFSNKNYYIDVPKDEAHFPGSNGRSDSKELTIVQKLAIAEQKQYEFCLNRLKADKETIQLNRFT